MLGYFDAVTTAEIAERTSLTERTYFRHFPDKPKVLLDGENVLAEALTAALADIPDGDPPQPTLLRAFHAIVPMLERKRPVSEPLARIAAVTPALRERQAAKRARLVEMLTDASGDRGVDDELAAPQAVIEHISRSATWGRAGGAFRRRERPVPSLTGACLRRCSPRC